MKIVLCSINSKYIHSSLGVWYLFAAAKKINADHTVTVVESTINNHVEDIVAMVEMEKPDVVGFSTYIWNVDYVHKVASTLKLINPDIKIWLGGPEASFDADSLLQKDYVDWVVKGEGESAFMQMLSEDFTTPSKTVVTGPCCEYINPYTDEYMETLKGRIVYLETSRGCPFSCGFCLSGRDENVRFFDMEESKRNIIKLANSGTKTVKFVDRTFNCNDKRALEIFKFITDERAKGTIPQDVIFHCEVETDLFTQSTLDYLKTVPSGLFQFEAGLQSFNVETLKAVNRRTNMEKLVHNLKEIVSGGNIHLHIDLIAGLPYEDFSSFAKSFNQAYDINANVIQLGFLKLLKGSTLEKEKEERERNYAPQSGQYRAEGSPLIITISEAMSGESDMFVYVDIFWGIEGDEFAFQYQGIINLFDPGTISVGATRWFEYDREAGIIEGGDLHSLAESYWYSTRPELVEDINAFEVNHGAIYYLTNE